MATRNDWVDGQVVTAVSWEDLLVAGGENVFTIFGNANLSAEQIESLTIDLYNVFSLAMNGSS